MGGTEHPDGAAAGRRGGGNEVTAFSEVGVVLQVGGDVHGDITVTHPPEREVPRQVVAPPTRFVDREDVTSWLTALVADASAPPRVAVLSGLPGVGKRAVARRFAFSARDRFPGGDLLAECERHTIPDSGGIVDVSGMLGACLRGLGVSEEYLPATLEARRDLLRTRTATRPVLVVAENATDPAQVRALLPNAPGSLVLVTTTVDLTELRLDGAEFREVTRLSEGHSAALFAASAGLPATGSVLDLARFCAGLPIALTVLAARAARPHEATLEELAAELSDERRRLKALSLGGRQIVSAVFSASYNRLPGQAQLLFRCLGVFPGPHVTVEAAAVAASLDTATARRLLGVLVDAHLLEFSGDHRYVFHELVRDHARDRALDDPLERREATIHQIVRHYLVKACFADRAMIPSRSRATDHDAVLAGHSDPFTGADPDAEATNWLDAERSNLAAIVRAASDAGLYAESWRLAEALLPYYFNQRHFADWIAVCDTGARAARLLDARIAEARLRLAASRAHTELENLSQARAEIDIARGLAEGSGDDILLASVWEFTGKLLDRSDPEAAVAAYERSRELNLSAGEPRGVALTFFYQGRALGALGRHDEALAMLRRAAGAFDDGGDPRMKARTLIALGSVLSRLDRVGEATELLDQAAVELAGKHYEAEARELLADLAERTGDAEAAKRHRLRAWQIYEAEGNPRADRLRPLI